MNYTVMILGMAAVTFVVKALLFIVGDRIVFPDAVRRALDFVPVAVLTAIVVPMVLAPHGAGLAFTWRNPYLIGSAVAIGVSAFTGHQLLTIVAGLAAFMAWQFGVVG